MATTFEQFKLAMQVQQILANLRRDMRANAQQYLDAVAVGKSLPAIVSVATANTARYQVLLDRLLELNGNVPLKTKVTAGLLAIDLLYTDVVAYYTELRAAATAEAAAVTAGITTNAQMQALANATLANVAAWDTIWANG